MRFLIVIFWCFAAMAQAEEPRSFRLTVPAALEEAGLIGYLLPRFALKTGRRGDVVTDAPDFALVEGLAGSPVFARGETVWSLVLVTQNDPGRRFGDWLLSDIGLNTVASFKPVKGEPFRAVVQTVAVAQVVFEGDAMRGLAVAQAHCGRCHRVAVTSATGIGSTPSFMALRALPDWAERFGAFYVLNPHPSFMLVDGISTGFDPSRPPALVPIILTQAEVEAVQAYVSGLAPADLGREVEAK